MSAGNFVAHEIIESYYSARFFPNALMPKSSASKEDKAYLQYLKSHNRACSVDYNYKEPTIELIPLDIFGNNYRAKVKYYLKNNKNYYYESWLW